MLNKIQLHFSSATITAVVAAAIAVAVSFGAHLSQTQTHDVLVLVGLLAGAVTIGGGIKSSGLIRAGLAGDTRFHFTSATIVSAIGAAMAVAVSFGLHLTPENKSSILTLVGLIAGGVTIGGAVKSRALLDTGEHPLQTHPVMRRGRTIETTLEGEPGLVGGDLHRVEAGLGKLIHEHAHASVVGDLGPEEIRPVTRRRREPEYGIDDHPILRVHGTFKGLGLGKSLQVKTDARTPVLAEFFTAAGPGLGRRLPAHVHRIPQIASEIGGDFGMMGNYVHGDCTCAALGHALQFWTGVPTGTADSPTTDDVLGLYWVTGTPPDPGADDNGRVMFDVLKYAHANGLFDHQLGAYVGVGLRRFHHRDVKAAIDMFGGCYLGVALPETAQSQAIWDVAGDPSQPGPAQPGTWGGHAIWCPDYDTKGVTCITWGHPQKMTWAFLDAYADEGYCIISPDWLAGGKTIEGFDLAALTAYLERIKSWQPPGS